MENNEDPGLAHHHWRELANSSCLNPINTSFHQTIQHTNSNMNCNSRGEGNGVGWKVPNEVYAPQAAMYSSYVPVRGQGANQMPIPTNFHLPPPWPSHALPPHSRSEFFQPRALHSSIPRYSNAPIQGEIFKSYSSMNVNSQPLVVDPVSERQEAQQLLEKWVLNCCTTQVDEQIVKEKPFSLLQVKAMLLQLKILTLKIQKELGDLSADDSKPNSVELVALQTEMQHLINTLGSEKTKVAVKSKVLKYRKVKERRKRRAVERQSEKQVCADASAKKSEAIDKWLQTIQDEKNKLEMKKNADIALSDVRRKIGDSERLIQTVKLLSKLRTIRKEQAEKKGLYSSHESDSMFSEKTQELLERLSTLGQTYKREEAALQAMLQEEQSDKIARQRHIALEKQLKRFEKEEALKKKWLFGDQEILQEMQPYYDFYNQASTDFNAFLDIRRQWDIFAVDSGTPVASRIPRGWVPPSQPSHSEWARYIKKAS